MNKILILMILISGCRKRQPFLVMFKFGGVSFIHQEDSKMKRKVILAIMAGISIMVTACGANKEEIEDVSAESVSQQNEAEDKQATTDVEADNKDAEEAGTDKTDDITEKVVTETATGEIYSATEEDESAIDISGSDNVEITGATVSKDSGDATSADDSSFKGVNAAVRVYDEATLTISNSKITADAKNATGVFAYDKGTIYISDSAVDVTGGGSGGIQVAGGGTLYATNLTVNSASKAAIRSDRGGGILEVDGGTYTSTGSNGCPAIYSTADITVKNADCVSENSRAVIIEGKNSVTLENSTLSGNDQSSKEGSIKANVLLYQSASGDAKEGTSQFTMTGGSMTNSSGAMFYCTNTSSIINLSNADLDLSEDGSLLIVSEGRWGKDGKNGGKCVLNASEQTLEGSITVDSISSLELNMSSSIYEGAINESGEAGEVSVTIDDRSTWTLTGDSYISEFNGDYSNVNTNGYSLYVGGSKVL